MYFFLLILHFFLPTYSLILCFFFLPTRDFFLEDFFIFKLNFAKLQKIYIYLKFCDVDQKRNGVFMKKICVKKFFKF